MDRQYIYKHYVIERYLADQLDDDEHEAFEEYCLDHPQMTDELMYVQALKEQVSEQLSEEPSITPIKPTTAKNFFTSPAWAKAATLLLGFSLVLGTTYNFKLRDLNSSPIYIGAEYTLGHNRSADILQINLPNPPSPVIFHIDVGPEKHTNYSVKFIDSDENVYWEQENLQLLVDGNLHFVLPAPKSGVTTLRVDALDSEGQSKSVELYRLHITP